MSANETRSESATHPTSFLRIRSPREEHWRDYNSDDRHRVLGSIAESLSLFPEGLFAAFDFAAAKVHEFLEGLDELAEVERAIAPLLSDDRRAVLDLAEMATKFPPPWLQELAADVRQAIDDGAGVDAGWVRRTVEQRSMPKLSDIDGHFGATRAIVQMSWRLSPSFMVALAKSVHARITAGDTAADAEPDADEAASEAQDAAGDDEGGSTREAALREIEAQLPTFSDAFIVALAAWLREEQSHRVAPAASDFESKLKAFEAQLGGLDAVIAEDAEGAAQPSPDFTPADVVGTPAVPKPDFAAALRNLEDRVACLATLLEDARVISEHRDRGEASAAVAQDGPPPMEDEAKANGTA
ncbi:MAG: hypothetical protein IT348_19390 [Candidatus Eisenbacteria bacterium]|nr:hypothetical protein [Candidatus Eisenbacteria bacterium]